jgi:hypothetical protein
MNHQKSVSNTILRNIIILSVVLVILIYFTYRPNSWPTGSESLGCLVSVILLSTTLLLLWMLKKRITDDSQKRNVASGLCFGLLWTIEIGINNLVHPRLPLRDYIDNTFWAIIALLILITAAIDAYKSNQFLSGLKSGFWSGLASGAVACLTALILIVFGMKSILLDPLNIKEWSDIKATADTTSMDVYFAYQTFAGAIMHLFILGVIMGLFLGSVGGVVAKALRIIKK